MRFVFLTALALVLVGGSVVVQAETILIPNASFESVVVAPVDPFVDLRIDAWARSPKGSWWDDNNGPWEQLSALFLNPTPDKADHLDNCDGTQAAYMFADPEVAIFQDHDSADYTGVATHAFDAKFEVGKSYHLTVGVNGGGGGMKVGVSMAISLYYRDGQGNQVPVATTPIVYNLDNFPNHTHLFDYQVNVPAVQAGDPWAGQYIGVQLASTTGFDLFGGYWDLDNVRLSAIKETILIPNASFESVVVAPVDPFVDLRIDAWARSPKGSWWDDNNGPWEQLSALFLNPTPDKADHLDNCDGTQAAYMFADPEVAIFQDHDSADYTGVATHAFDAKFEVGKSYHLTVGVNGGGGGMKVGVSMAISLYYRDGQGNQVPVATTPIVYNLDNFPNHTHLFDYQVNVPAVQAGDPWAGQYIGVQLASTTGFDLFGGYWDLDNVRLSGVPESSLTSNQAISGSDFRISWISSVGYQYQVKISEDLISWSDYGTPLNGVGGELIKLIPLSSHSHAFVTVVATPLPLAL